MVENGGSPNIFDFLSQINEKLRRGQGILGGFLFRMEMALIC